MASTSKKVKTEDEEEVDFSKVEENVDLYEAQSLDFDAEIQINVSVNLSSSTSTSSTSSTIKIKEISKENGKYLRIMKEAIVAKILWKTGPQIYTSVDGKTTFFRVIIGDEKDALSQIRISFFNSSTDRFFNFLQVGKSYVFKDFEVQKASSLFNPLIHECELSAIPSVSTIASYFGDDSSFPNDLIPTFTSLGDIEHLPQSSCIQIIGCVHSVSDSKIQFSAANGETYSTIKLHIVDESMSQMTVRLWNEEAEKFVFVKGQPLMIIGIKIQININGKKIISILRCHKLKVLPVHSRTQELIQWWSSLMSPLFTPIPLTGTSMLEIFRDALRFYQENQKNGVRQQEAATQFGLNIKTFNAYCTRNKVTVWRVADMVNANQYYVDGQKSKPKVTLKGAAERFGVKWENLNTWRVTHNFTNKRTPSATLKDASGLYDVLKGTDTEVSLQKAAKLYDVTYESLVKWRGRNTVSPHQVELIEQAAEEYLRRLGTVDEISYYDVTVLYGRIPTQALKDKVQEIQERQTQK